MNCLRGRLLCLNLLLLFLAPTLPLNDTISLKPESLGFVPSDYYIAVVTDERSGRGLGRWFTAANGSGTPVDLPGGTAEGIEQFVRQNLRQNPKQRAVAIRLRECRINETARGNRVDGTFTFSVSFELLRNADGEAIPVKLTDYRTRAQYVRPASQTQVVEQSIRQSVVAALRTFDNYMRREGKADNRLATKITVKLLDYVPQNDSNSDTVFYSLNRPITWSDFRATPRRGSRYAAEINPNFSYQGQSRVMNGVVELTLVFKTFMVKSGSWVTAPALNEYALNHEQRHFDITRIITERFKNKLNPDSLSIEDYNSNVQYHFLESYREMSRMQELYDEETNHGINRAAQERWNARIDADLRMYGIRK
jgi:hypothetical protein